MPQGKSPEVHALEFEEALMNAVTVQITHMPALPDDVWVIGRDRKKITGTSQMQPVSIHIGVLGGGWVVTKTSEDVQQTIDALYLRFPSYLDEDLIAVRVDREQLPALVELIAAQGQPSRGYYSPLS